MPATRRSIVAALCLGAPLFRPLALRAAEAEGTVTTVPDPAEFLLRAAATAPNTCRATAAIDSTAERLRSLAVDPQQGRVILVNIAGAEVIAQENGQEVLRSRVIVGTGRNRTPELSSPVPSVRLNPPWYVPASIEQEMRNAGSAFEGFRRVGNRYVQPPGPRNPLGPIRIGLEDSQGVYLHGTSDPRLFARGARTLSHGCVRVEKIFELAAWILDTTPEALRAAVATGRTVELTPEREVTAVLAYLTAWPRNDGRIAMHPDPYGRDRAAAHCRAPTPPPVRSAAREPG